MIASGVFATVMLAKTAMRARKARKQASSPSSLLFEDWNINFNLPPKLITRCAVCWRRRSAKGGFGSIYSALWVDGPRWEYVPNAEGFLGSMWKRKGACKVALKMLDNSKDIRPEFLHEGLRPQILEGTPKQYVELMKICWQRDPIGRPSAADLVKKLEMLMNDQEINNGVVPTIHIDETYHPDAVYTSRPLQFPNLKNTKFDSNFEDVENMENDTN
ncbi:2883_t:CDS:2, partial [Gigaspora margarita]